MKTKITRKYGLARRIDYEGDPGVIEDLIKLWSSFGNLAFGMVLPQAGAAMIYGDGNLRVKVTRISDEACTVEATKEKAEAQTWESKYGYFYQTFTGNEKAMVTLAKLDSFLGGVNLPKGIGESSTIMSPSIGEVKLTRTGENQLKVVCGRSLNKIKLDRVFGK